MQPLYYYIIIIIIIIMHELECIYIEKTAGWTLDVSISARTSALTETDRSSLFRI